MQQLWARPQPPAHTHTHTHGVAALEPSCDQGSDPRPDLGPILELRALLTADQQQPEAGWSFHARRKWGALSGVAWIPQPPDSRSSRLVALPYPALLQFRHRLGPRQPPPASPAALTVPNARFCSGYVCAEVCAQKRVRASVCLYGRVHHVCESMCVQACVASNRACVCCAWRVSCVCARVGACACKHVRACVCARACACHSIAYVRVCAGTCVHVYVHVRACICVCLCSV